MHGFMVSRPGRGQGQAACLWIEQRNAERALELTYALRDCALREAQLVGREAEFPAASNIRSALRYRGRTGCLAKQQISCSLLS